MSGAGSIRQVATTAKGSKRITRCRSTRSVAAAGAYSVTCNLGAKGRAALRNGALKLRVVTTFTPVAGVAVVSTRNLTAKRRR